MGIEEREEGVGCSGTPKPFLKLAVRGTDDPDGRLLLQTECFYKYI